MRKMLLSFLFILLILPFIKVSAVHASEGIFRLENQIGTAARCYVTSGLMENRKFNVLTLCRDILYPGGSDVYSYVVWATSIDGSNPKKLGELGRGKVLFQTTTPFNSLFVTKELDSKVKAPTGQVIMQGELQTIDFLGQAPDNDQEPPANSELSADASPTASPQAETQPSNTRNIFRIIALGGILAFLAIFGVVLIIFVVSRR